VISTFASADSTVSGSSLIQAPYLHKTFIGSRVG
jgi:hypothetical protein